MHVWNGVFLEWWYTFFKAFPLELTAALINLCDECTV